MNRKVFCKNDGKTTLKLYMITQQIYLKKMTCVPEFVALYEICRYIRNLPLNNESIRVAVRDYFSGDKEKDAIIKKYGRIEDWNTSKVTDMSFLFKFYYYYSKKSKYIQLEQSNKINQDISKWDTSNVTNTKK